MDRTVYDHYFLQMTAVVAKIFLIFVPPGGLAYPKSTLTFSFQISSLCSESSFRLIRCFCGWRGPGGGDFA